MLFKCLPSCISHLTIPACPRGRSAYGDAVSHRPFWKIQEKKVQGMQNGAWQLLPDCRVQLAADAMPKFLEEPGTDGR